MPKRKTGAVHLLPERCIMRKTTQSTTSSTTVADSAHLTADLVFSDLPSLGKAPNVGQADLWREKTMGCANASATFASKKRSAARQLVAMVIMDTQLASTGYYEGQLKEAKLGIPHSKNSLAAAFAWYLKLDVANADKKKKSDDAKTLNRYFSAGQRLRRGFST